MKQTNQDPKKVKQGCAIMSVAGVVFLFFAVKCSCESSPEEIRAQDESARETKREINAYSLARQAVEDKVHPVIADFNILDTETKKLSDSVYFVRGSFDYNNATLKANYKCLVVMRTDSTGVCNSVVVE